MHAVVARSTFGSQNVQNTSVSDDVWKLRGRKSARRCGAKTFPSQHVQNTSVSEHFWKLRCRKMCAPVWREAPWEVKMLKTRGVWTTFGSSELEKVHAVVVRSTFRSQNVKTTRGSDHVWRFRCRFASLRFTTLHSLRYTSRHDTTRHHTTLGYTTLHYTT